MQNTIFINGRFLTRPVTGVQRYSLELLHHIDLLLEEKSAYRGVNLACLVPPEEIAYPAWKNIQIRRVGKNKGNLWEQVDLPHHAQGALLFSLANIGPWRYPNQVVTFHDASVFAVPGSYSLPFRAKYTFVFGQLVHRARLILTDSHFSQQQLAHYLAVAPARFTVIPLGSDHLDAIQPDPRILERHSLKKDSYFFTIASQGRHKNLANVFEAIDRSRPGVDAVIVGGTFSQVFQNTKSPLTSKRVKSLGYVEDAELKSLYQNALGFIFPSTYEGFGLPVLEAMRCGCPVLCSNAASLPEVAGGAALYFDPCDVGQMVEAIDSFVAAPQLHEQLRAKGYQQSNEFLWQTTAQRTLEQLLNA